MSTRISTNARNAAAEAIALLLDAADPTPGYVEVRVGTQPATAGDTATGAVLATIVLPLPAFDAPSGGVATAFAVDTVTGTGDGDAGWFRAYDGNDAVVFDGSVTASGGGGQMQLNTITISTGVDFAVISFTITMPAA